MSRDLQKQSLGASFWSARGLPPLWIGRSFRKGLWNSVPTLPIVFALALLAACATTPPDKYAQPTTNTPLSKRKITVTVFTNSTPNITSAENTNGATPSNATPSNTTPTNAPTPPPPKYRILPFTARIASVNEKLRFVIVDFTNARQPTIDERLGVYRVGEKVAEIKISGPYRNTTVAADIIAGEVKYGDEVKTD